MRSGIQVKHACGCDVRHEAECDVRSWRSVARTLMFLRATNPSGEVCLRCQLAADRAASLGTPMDDPARWPVRRAHARAAIRVARLTGGSISRSPKSESVYVTWPGGAWRVSDHPWPGRHESLISERRLGYSRRTYIARLATGWLERERSAS